MIAIAQSSARTQVRGKTHKLCGMTRKCSLQLLFYLLLAICPLRGQPAEFAKLLIQLDSIGGDTLFRRLQYTVLGDWEMQGLYTWVAERLPTARGTERDRLLAILYRTRAWEAASNNGDPATSLRYCDTLLQYTARLPNRLAHYRALMDVTCHQRHLHRFQEARRGLLELEALMVAEASEEWIIFLELYNRVLEIYP
ncbi:MAG: hypothetical protein AAFZ52_00720, partial [Bacteroidota bacterium]